MCLLCAGVLYYGVSVDGGPPSKGDVVDLGFVLITLTEGLRGRGERDFILQGQQKANLGIRIPFSRACSTLQVIHGVVKRSD